MVEECWMKAMKSDGKDGKENMATRHSGVASLMVRDAELREYPV